MPKTVCQVFLSSTSQDLTRHRAKVREAIERLGQASICMETFGTKPSTPLDTCREQVRQADALVVVVGHRYGWIPSHEEGGDGTKSITRWEVEWALGATPAVPVYAYLVDPSAEWTGEKEQDRLHEAKTAEEAGDVFRAVKGLDDLRNFLESKTTRALFTSVDDLFGKAAADLSAWLQEQLSKTVPRRGDFGVEERVESHSQTAWTGSPFPGLRAFTPADEPVFFGRDRETRHLVKKLSDSSCRFLLVVGTSGSGKSSLVAAGLVPHLAANAIPGSEDWLLPDVHQHGQGHTWVGLRFTPGEQGVDPFQALAARLAPMLPGGRVAPDVAKEIAESPQRFPALLDEVLAGTPPRAQALIFIDQFEELVTLVTDAEMRNRFVEMLSATVRRDSSRIRIVGTVRSDFYHRCIESQPHLAELLREHGVTVPLAVPSPSALNEMTEAPARVAGLRFDDGLVDSLVDGTVSSPGGLALLAFALHELYEQRTAEGRLTDDAYRAFGELAGVIGTRADATFDALHVPEQTLRAVFSQLIAVDEHGLATRRWAPRDDVERVDAGAGGLIAGFEKARLLVPDRAEDGTVVLQVAHEALFREWPRLSMWIEERSDDLRLVRQVETAAIEWERHQRTTPYAWAQERLEPVYRSLERLGRTRDGLDELTRTFVRPEWERLTYELEVPTTTHQRRAAIGDRLDQIGDSRAQVGLRADGTPDIAWCKIPSGSVTLENVDGTFEVEALYMAKYAVTYCQYKTFLDDSDGYRDKRHWKGLERETEPGEQFRPNGNHPADHVSWYDATAFCRWLSGHLGFEVRLPSEWEWQQAATGGEAARGYPWGSEWQDARGNTIESRLSRTISVGMYPQGVSQQGVLDLAGNVFEWCSNQHDNPRSHERRVKHDVPRVVRGGSWLGDQSDARATYRGGGHPDGRNNVIGFRVVCVSPSLERLTPVFSDHWHSD